MTTETGTPVDPVGDRPARVSVCVPTRLRPGELRRLLASLRTLTFERLPPPTLQVVIVDNSEAGELLGSDHELAGLSGWPTRVVHEPRQGIPFARNAAVDLVADRSDYVVFVDDDETVTPGWLEQLIIAAEGFSADVVAGPTRATFPAEAATWLARPEYYERPDAASGTVLRACSTCNVLVRGAVFQDGGFRFDTRLAGTGGSDTELFRRVSDAGYRIIWNRDAVVHDHIPMSRLTLRWLLRRRFRNGNVEAWDIRTRFGWWSRGALALVRKSVGRLLGGILVALGGSLRGRQHVVVGLRQAAWGLGALAGLAGARYAEYGGTATDSVELSATSEP